jgi:hypothetical protein
MLITIARIATNSCNKWIGRKSFALIKSSLKRKDRIEGNKKEALNRDGQGGLGDS